MSDLTVSSSIGNLTKYSVDGLELFFTPDRKVRASQSAIARMCSTNKTVAQAQIRQYIQKLVNAGYLKNDVLQAESRTGNLVVGYLLYDAVVIRKCLQNYNPELAEQFADYGVSEGLAQMAGVPVKVVAPQLSSIEQQMVNAENSLKLLKLQYAAQNNPGDIRQMEEAIKVGTNVLEGNMTLKEMKTKAGFDYDGITSRLIGLAMTHFVRGRKECGKLPTRSEEPCKANGYRRNPVNTYPASMYVSYLSICTSHGIG